MDVSDNVENDTSLAKSMLERTAAYPPSNHPEKPESVRESQATLRSPRSQEKRSENVVLLTPAMRHVLKEAKIDINDVRGSGRDGRITRKDVQHHTLASKNTNTSNSSNDFDAAKLSERDQVLEFTPTENAMFRVMDQSLKIPHFLFAHTVDFTSINKFRRDFNSKNIGSSASKLTPLPFLMKALSQAMLLFPKLNSHLDTATNPSKPRLILRNKHNLGLAIDTPKGLLVPVVKDVQEHTIESLAAEIKRLSDLAHAGRLMADDFKDATFTISNIGSIGGDVVAPIIVAPMVGIVAMGRIREVPVFSKDEQGRDQIVKLEQMTLSWSADHRIIDGATVAKAAKAVEGLLCSGLN